MDDEHSRTLRVLTTIRSMSELTDTTRIPATGSTLAGHTTTGSHAAHSATDSTLADRHTELLVLGAGPGGYVAAIRAAQLGLHVTIVEQKYWGGVCLNVGCIPSKALLKNAEVANLVLRHAAEFGVLADNISMDFGVAHARSRKVSASIVKGVHYLMRKNKITEVEGRGTFLDAHTIQVDTADGAVTISFDNCIIATGAHVAQLPNVELGGPVVSFEEQILDPALPHSIVIVGAGAIGMEFAYVLANYGVQVTIVEYLDRVLPNEDRDVSKELAKQYQKLGITLRTGYKTTAVERTGDGVAVTIEPVASATEQAETGATTGQAETIYAERCLISTGFRPNVEGYGLDTTGVQLTERGAIAVDDVMRTSVPHIFAIGDVTAKLQLAHVAEMQGVVAAETIAGQESLPMGDYRMMPRATFCNPQVASFGLTEEQARAAAAENPELDVRVSTFPFSANGKAQGLGEAQGFVKIVADGRYGELLGAHMVGPQVSELLPELVLAQKWELTSEEIARTVHVHPTLAEAMREAAEGVLGDMLNL